MTELHVEADGLRISIGTDAATEVLWVAAQAAFKAVQGALRAAEANNATTSTCRRRRIIKKPSGKRTSKAAQIRVLAAELLADGRVHERRELAKAVRAKGLNPQLIGGALDSHFEKGQNALGRPTYRDRTVPSGYETSEPVPDGEKPAWMRDRRPAEWKDPAATGTWGSAGVKLDAKNGA